MNLEFKKILVTAERAETFPAACDFVELLVKYNKPTDVGFLFTNDDLEHFGGDVKVRVAACEDQMHAIGIATEHTFKHGNFHRGAINLAQNFGAELIICGAELVTGFRRFWNGSETYKLIKSAPCYVVSLQKQLKRPEIKKIVLPIDSSQETRQKVPAAIAIAKMFDATVHVVGVASSGSEDITHTVHAYTQQTIDFLESHGVKTETAQLVGSNITDITLQYVDDADADMLMIMAVEEPNPYGMLEGSFPEQMILKSSVPIMAVQERDDIKVSSFQI
jgi:nucleotide-binding universal stress UspA family protein